MNVTSSVGVSSCVRTLWGLLYATVLKDLLWPPTEETVQVNQGSDFCLIIIMSIT